MQHTVYTSKGSTRGNLQTPAHESSKSTPNATLISERLKEFKTTENITSKKSSLKTSTKTTEENKQKQKLGKSSSQANTRSPQKKALKSVGANVDLNYTPMYDKHGDLYMSLKYKWRIITQSNLKKTDNKGVDPAEKLRELKGTLKSSQLYTFNRDKTEKNSVQPLKR